MSEIDAKSLTVEERAIVDGIYLILRSNCTNGTEAERYADAVRQSCEAILARRALFAPAASEPEKVECPNCREETDSGLGHRRLRPVYGDDYICKPAPPEPAAPEIPEAVREALSQLAYHASCPHELESTMEQTLRIRDALESWWRTHAQPVANVPPIPLPETKP